MRGVITTLITLCGVLVALCAEASEPQGALIELSTKEIDLGDLLHDDDKQLVRLEYRNVGDLPLVITEVRTSCACTTVRYERGKLLPGERGVINITFDPRKGSLGMLYRVLQIFSTSTGGVEHVTLKANILE